MGGELGIQGRVSFPRARGSEELQFVFRSWTVWELASSLRFPFASPYLQLGDPVAGAGGPGSRFKGKHSLDSDEEDDDEEGSSKYDILASEDVEGEPFPTC